jgi:hypothetical protein
MPKPNPPSWLLFAVYTLGLLFATHAIGFFAHEYAHSTTAWALGWKANPLALNYGPLTASNVLLQLQIDENVDYAPIFAAGHFRQAGLIAAAGVVAGNFLLTYSLSRGGFAWARQRGQWGWARFFFWLGIMSVGNLICYVPVRTFSSHGDMHTVAQGFNCSPGWILLVLGLPFGLALLEFLFRLLPAAIRELYPAVGQQRVVAMLSAFVLFGFYGLAGWSDNGVVAHQLAVLCVAGLFPALALTQLFRTRQVQPDLNGLAA